jgi:ParB-like chromosome segregation protein Spo0J
MPKPAKNENYRKAVKRLGDPLDRTSLGQSRNRTKRKSKDLGPIRIEWTGPDSLKGDPKNPRLHSPQQIRALGRNIQKYGFTNPILVDPDDNVIAGHGRLEASKLISLPTVPIIRLNLSQAQSKALNLWDNRSSDLSHFDDKLLGLALQQVIELKIDIEDTGFSVAEADRVIQLACPTVVRSNPKS